MLPSKSRHPFCLIIFSAHTTNSFPSTPKKAFYSLNKLANAQEPLQSSTTLKMPIALTMKKIDGKPGKVYYP